MGIPLEGQHREHMPLVHIRRQLYVLHLAHFVVAEVLAVGEVVVVVVSDNLLELFFFLLFLEEEEEEEEARLLPRRSPLICVWWPRSFLRRVLSAMPSIFVEAESESDSWSSSSVRWSSCCPRFPPALVPRRSERPSPLATVVVVVVRAKVFSASSSMPESLLFPLSSSLQPSGASLGESVDDFLRLAWRLEVAPRERMMSASSRASNRC